MLRTIQKISRVVSDLSLHNHHYPTTAADYIMVRMTMHVESQRYILARYCTITQLTLVPVPAPAKLSDYHRH